MKQISSIFTVSLMVLILGVTGCGLQKTGTQKVRDLDYTVVTEQELPEELQKEINERYTEDFKMTCMLDDSLYIVRGFGMQETGGYGLRFKICIWHKMRLILRQILIGPENGAEAEKAVSYPYIVVKTERLEENVVFE